jgi:hypothetical protein
VVDSAVVRLNVAAAQVLQAVDVMRVPVSEVLNFTVPVLDFAEDLFLIRAILKELDIGSAGLRPGFNDPSHGNVESAVVNLVRTNDATAGFILIKAVAFIKNGGQRSLRYDKAHLIGGVKFHCDSP